MVGKIQFQQRWGAWFIRLGHGSLLALVWMVVQCSVAPSPPHEDNTISVTPQAYWPHQQSDLKPDPNVIFGRLTNGVRYVLKQNHTPSDRVSMHLYIQAGSLAEADHEQGVAHFLEHMLFNGSTHFAPGEMIKYFQRIGMQFGPDANAHTGFDRTVYDIILPDGKPDSLSEALVVLKDYAQGALLLPDEVDKEKKVVLAEMRSRDSARYRTLKATMEFELPGLIIGKRLPIGEQAIIQNADAALLHQFYDAWYRPERMVIVMVGDFDTAVARKLIQERFGDMTSRADERPIPAVGHMEHKENQFFYHREPEAGATTVSIESVVQATQPMDSKQRQREELLQNIAIQIVQKRLEGMMQQPDAVFSTADNHAGYYLHQIRYAEIRAVTKPGHWQKALSLLDQTLRQAVRHGFTPTELDVAKGDALAELNRAAQEQDTRESKAIARHIIGSLSNWSVFQSPVQHYEYMKPLLERMTLKEVNQAFARIWNTSHRLVLVTGNAALTTGHVAPVKQIETAYLASRQRPVAPPENKKRAHFPYLPQPTAAGGVKERQKDGELGIERVVFDNGFILLLKPTRFKDNQILATLSFGGGKSSEPSSLPGLAQWTQAVVNESGFGALDRLALEDALAGRWAGIQLAVQEAMFTLQGEAVTSELELLLQLMQTAVQDPGFRAEAHQLIFRQFEQQGQRLPKSVEGVMALRGQRFLSSGDSRFGIPEWEQLQEVTLDQIKQWYTAQLRQSPLELAVVGDFDPDTLVALTSRYFGTLPKRSQPFKPTNRPGPQFPVGESTRLTAQTKIDKALVVVAYPTEDFWDIHRTRRLAMLAELYSERLRQHVREELGAAYSPYAYNRSYRSYPGFGVLQIHVLVDPGQTDTIVDEVRRIADALIAMPRDMDEFRRVLDPTLTQVKDLRQTNKYWLNSVLKGAGRHPEQMAWARSFEKDYAAITLDEVLTLAKTYLDNDRVATIVIKPVEDANK